MSQVDTAPNGESPIDNNESTSRTQPDAPPVLVTWRQREPVEITIDPDNLLWDDLLELQDIQAKAEAGEISQHEMMTTITDLLTKLTGVDMRTQPARVVSALFGELTKLAGGLDTKN